MRYLTEKNLLERKGKLIKQNYYENGLKIASLENKKTTERSIYTMKDPWTNKLYNNLDDIQN